MEAMDQELAQAVLTRWQEGLPVYEGTFYKAASVLGLDPDLALAEARYYTYLNKLASANRPMTLGERLYFSTAAGEDPLVLTKTAQSYQLSPDEIVWKTLEERSFVPDIEKLALLGMLSGPPGSGQDAAAPAAAQAAAEPPPEAPQPGAQLQQPAGMAAPTPPAPQAPPIPTDADFAGFTPSPSAPQGQVPPSAGGNLEELLQGAQQADAAPMGGGLPPSGMGAQATPPPPTGPEKIMQAYQGQIDQETAERYGKELEQLEQQMGMSIQDPKQIEKFVKEIQKSEKKVVDEHIKAYGQQKQQEVAAQTGTGGGAALDDTAPKPLKQESPAAGQGGPKDAEAPIDPQTKLAARGALRRFLRTT